MERKVKLLGHIALTAVLATLPATAETPTERLLLDAMRCDVPASPTPLLRALAAAQMIALDKRMSVSLLSCWPFESELVLSGLRFTSICANEIDESVRAQNIDLYGEEPLYVPLQALTLGSPEASGDLVAWSKSALGAADGNVLILDRDATTLGDASELSCSVWVE